MTHDVSLRRKAEQQLIENQQRLDRMAHHDQLTGLPNRHYLTAFLPEAIEEAKAASTMMGVVFLDLDRFKHINDTRGHETGDKLLQEVAKRLRACVRDTDVVIRMGGDEFVVVFRNVKNYDEVTMGAGRIIETLNRPIIIDRAPAADHRQRRRQPVSARRRQHDRAAQALGYGHVPGQGSRPQQCADVQSCDEPQAQASSGRRGIACARHCA